MSSGCPPQSPAVEKTEVAVEGECPLLAATFAYWDNILGPRVHHIWAPKGDQLMHLSDGEVTFLANHTLNGEILRSAVCGAVDGYNIISVLSLEIAPIMELLASMKSHSVPEDIDIKDTLLNDDDIGDSCHEGFLHKAISSHLQTCGCSIVVGSNPEKVNKIVRTLCLFLTPAERKCSRLCRANSSFKYDTGLFVQGLLKDSTGSFVLPFRQVLYSPYPTTHIDVDINTVKQMPPCHEHTFNQRRYMRSELNALWKTDSEEDIPPETVIHTDETFTPDLNIFQDVMHNDTLVKSFIEEVFMLKPGLSLRSTYLAQFLLLLHRKALTLLKYIEDETQKGKKPFRSLRNLKTDLDLKLEGDLNIIMALAEKLRAGLHSFVFGKPFYTSVQERDALMSF
ncbi:LOW QUALITY PROTEIN: guanine nucleotide exchange C9orf72 homolog [Cyprinodon tularosa]|uniref:LOW QUALITY PROTEIN: guanine nucleotide exchange C9orf72 homolog n=1 Tax=Cyprinodon tularosa TaxID=77115 RepID=UPI0018E273AF|nr:LOW QUALITY PROTEIN: guanine nucleotide exchange C9orf72 homolog [Cyprinodon tularosa]